jgi:hypothetical protein
MLSAADRSRPFILEDFVGKRLNPEKRVRRRLSRHALRESSDRHSRQARSLGDLGPRHAVPLYSVDHCGEHVSGGLHDDCRWRRRRKSGT